MKGDRFALSAVALPVSPAARLQLVMDLYCYREPVLDEHGELLGYEEHETGLISRETAVMLLSKAAE